MNSRTPRALETREEEERPVYKPPTLLPVPLPQTGYRFRWIRSSYFGLTDNKNVSQRMRENWVPVKAEDHPELQIRSDEKSSFPGCVEVGGLLLCKTSEENVMARKKYYETMAQQQMTSVDNNFLRENDPRMPLVHQRKSSTTIGRKS